MPTFSRKLREPASGAAETAGPCRGLRLEDVAGAAGLSFIHQRGATEQKHPPETMGSGLAWLDFDGDGWWDLYAVQSGPFPPGPGPREPDVLFRNRGDGTFEAVEGAGSNRGYGQGVTAADADGDGSTELYLTRFGPDALLRNGGDGTFEDGTARAGLGLGGWSSSAAFADADGDGDLDLYVARYFLYDPAEPFYCGDVEAGERTYCHPSLFEGEGDRFYANRGDGTFEDATAAAGLERGPGEAARGLGVLFTDLDGDLDPELYVANDLHVNFLYGILSREEGELRFEDVSLLSAAGLDREGQAEAGMGVAVGDVDADGDPDLAVSNFDVETNTLYENLGDLLFDDVSAASGFGVPSFNLLGFGLVFADLDRDGDLDAYVANGHILEEPERRDVGYAQRDLLLLGDGEGGFREARCGPAFSRAYVGRGAAAGDFDNDGDPDLAVQNSGGPLQLLENRGTRGAWLGVRLRGSAPNTESVGARVALRTPDRPPQHRWVTAGDSYQSTSDRRLLFGLPADRGGVTLEITWPSGGRRWIVGAPVGRYLNVGE